LDYLFDILTLGTNKGPFIINKHSAAKQIWLASPISGPYHFDPKDGKWINRDDKDLYQILNSELKEFLDIELQYE
jgi:CyaY protein